MKVWRISNYADLSGGGGKFSKGRWNHLGTEIVYCSDHPSTCLLELLVRFDPDLTPSSYQLLEIEIPDSSKIIKASLPEDWIMKPSTTRDIWDDFCKSGAAPVLMVPSVIMRDANHYLLNPAHPDHKSNSIISSNEHFLDPRFYG